MSGGGRPRKLPARVPGRRRSRSPRWAGPLRRHVPAWIVLVLLTGGGCSSSDATLERVRSLHDADRYAESIEPLRELVDRRPSDPEILFLYGRALWSAGRFGLALWPLEAAMEDPGYRVRAGRLFVNSLLLNEAWDAAEEAADEILAETGENAEILALRAWARQGSRRDYEGALADAERVLELAPDNTDVLVPRAVSLLALRRVDEAGEALRELDELYRDESLGLQGSAKFCTAGATFALEKGEQDRARERFERCLEEFPTSSILLSEAIAFYDARRETERSIEILQRALEAEPESQRLRDRLAFRLHSMGRTDEARALLQTATELDSAIARLQAWVSLARFRSTIGELDGALAAYERALDIATSPSPELAFAYADALVQAGRLEEAMEWSEQLSVAPHRSLIRGRALLDLGRPAEALEHLTEGNLLWPNNAVARYYTAVAAERVGDLDRAVEEYRYSLRADATATDAALRLSSLYEARGMDDRALSVLSSAANEGNPESFAMKMRAVRLMAKVGAWNDAPRPFVASLATPTFLARGAAAVAEGIHDRDGPAAAIAYLEKTKGLQLTRPRDLAALTRLVEWLPAVGRAEDALGLVRRAREAHPDFPPFRALHAAALESAGAEPERVREAFERAVELDATLPLALRGLARSAAAAGDPSRAIELYTRAIELEPRDDRAARALATLLERDGRPAEAVDVLEALLREQPWNAEAALALAELRLDLGGAANRARARELVERARQLEAGIRDLRTRLDAVESRLAEEARATAAG